MDEKQEMVLKDLEQAFLGRAKRLRGQAAKLIVEAESLEACSFDVAQAMEKLVNPASD